jgi:hypothetical protein
MRHKILRALDDPGEVAHAQLVAVDQRRRKRQASRMSQALRPRGRSLGLADAEPPLPQSLGRRQVEAKQVTAILGHENILMDVRLFPAAGQG